MTTDQALIRIGIDTAVVEAGAVASACADLPGVAIIDASGERDMMAIVESCDALVLDGSGYSEKLGAALRADNSRVRWLQFASVGYDRAEAIGVPAGVAVTNGRGVWGATVAEHAVAMTLALLRALPQAERQRAAGQWDFAAMAPRLRSLESAQVGIIGFGDIGQELAARLKAFGAVTHAVSRSPSPHALADATCALEAIGDLLPGLDIVILALPLNADTQDMVDTDWLMRMKPGAYLVNVGRGGLVDEAALAIALHEGYLGGAALDVTRQEPLPVESPLWNCPNLIVTPHLAGTGGSAPTRLIKLCRTNIDRFRQGQSLMNRVALK